MSEQPPQGYYYPPPPRQAPFQIGAAVRWAWLKLWQHWRVFLVGMLPALAVTIAFYIYYLSAFVPIWLDSMQGRTTSDSDALDMFKRIGIAYAVLVVAAIPLSIVHANLVRAALLVADGGTPTLRMLFSTRRAGRTMLTTFSIGFLTLLGMLLCYLPGLAFATFAFFTFPFLLDRDLPMLASIEASFGLVKANLGISILTALVVGAIAAGGSAALIVGIVVAGPLGILTQVYAYRALIQGRVVP